MLFIRLSLLVVSALLCSSCTRPVQAQPPAGNVAVIRPTDNGYDDLLAALDIIRDKPSVDADPDAAPPPPSVLDKAQQPNATLADKRAAVRDPRFRQAFALLHTALSKPILKPPVQAYSEVFPAMAGLRNLSRYLSIQEYVQLADGATSSALDTLEEQIALGDAMQHWGFISALTGQAVIAIGVSPIARHLDRLSAGDCARLFGLLRAEVNTPNPAIDGLHAESARVVAGLRDMLKMMAQVAEKTAPTSGNNDAEDETSTADALNAAEAKELESLLKQKGTALDALTENIARRVASLNEAVIAANLDPSAPVPPKMPSANEADAIAEKIAGSFAPKANSVGGVLDHAAVSRATLQLLAVSAAISRYRWEHNALPDSLAPLKLGTLATDPFTQGMIVYARSLDRKQYSLSCAGPLPRDADQKVIPNGTRKPVTLP